MIEQTGECEIDEADNANIPVNIFLREVEDDDEEANGKKWQLVADNFMPRKGRCSGSAYNVYADTKEELQELVKRHVLPLYQNAIRLLEGIINGTNDGLYYWTEKE